MQLQYRIIRGKEELTGNLIEFSLYGAKILVECGKSLRSSAALTETERIVLTTRYDAVIVTHNHADHNGLIHLVDKKIPVYSGRISREIFCLQHAGADVSNFRTYYDGAPFYVGSIRITPYLCDHSAPDSYMLLIEGNGKSILYTGDFRSHGRKSFDALLERFPKKIDTVITEGTNFFLGKTFGERALEKKLTDLFNHTEKPVFVIASTTNIDRIVSAYKASARSGRDFLVDIEEERILEIMGASVPKAKTFDKVKVYYPKSITDFSSFCDVRKKSVSIRALAPKTDYVMMVKTSTLPYLRKLAKLGDNLKGATLVYSLWSGYLETDGMQKFIAGVKKLGMNVVNLHASGHADKTTVMRLLMRCCPNEVVWVHTPFENFDYKKYPFLHYERRSFSNKAKEIEKYENFNNE